MVKILIVTTIFSVSFLLLPLFPAPSAASSLTLAWNPNTEDDLAGYKVYYGTRSQDYDSVADAGKVTQHIIRGLEPETQYFFALTAYDFSGNESDFSGEISAITDDEPAPAPSPHYFIDSEDDDGCFIATTAYGSYLNPRIKILRDFRDEMLSSNSLGKEFIHLYYQYGPRIANHIEQYDFLQFLSRQALLPLIGMSSLSLRTTALQKILLMVLFLSIFTLTFRSYFWQNR